MTPTIKITINGGPTRHRIFRALSDPFPLQGDPMLPEHETKVKGNLGMIRRSVDFSFVHPRSKQLLPATTHILGIKWIGILMDTEVEIEGWIVDSIPEWKYRRFSATYNLREKEGHAMLNESLVAQD